MDSIDIGHVPPPDPEYFWDFTVGQQRTLVEGIAGIALEEIDSKRVKVSLRYKNSTVSDWLNMDRPCVALRTGNGRPHVTLTLRKIEGETAYLQVTVPPEAPQMSRTH